ncbi:MAG TPA: metalloregulator ArsR/SmtB family transcription factor [Chitinivibrionales bacterium]|nr:metalloregulator ArsR/SmtB family transcription factor [Chitinivibrionales bacterium]
MKEMITIAKALSDANRVRTLFALRKGELCVCRIIELLGLAPSTVSKHMTVLKHAGLVNSRKEKRWIYYRLPEALQKTPVIHGVLDWLFISLTKDNQIIEDGKKLSKILQRSPEYLCKKRQDKFQRRKDREAS